MAKQKQKWTFEEEEALCAGVEKYGHGRWKVILSDPQYASSLANRSNIDLKDKWRNLAVCGNGSSSRERVRTRRLEVVATPEPLSAVPLLEYGGTARPSRSSADRIPGPECLHYASRSSADRITGPEYDAMIFEAVLNINDLNRKDDNAIFEFMEQMHDLPANARSTVYSRIKRLVLGGGIEKVGDCYKWKGSVSGAETSRLEDAKTKRKKGRKARQEDVRRNNNQEQKAPDICAMPFVTEKSPKSFPAPKSSDAPCAIAKEPKNSTASLTVEEAPEASTAPRAIAKAPEKSATPVPAETLHDASLYASYTASVARILECDAIEACKKADMVEGFLQESMVMLKLAEELREQCSRDGMVLLAP